MVTFRSLNELDAAKGTVTLVDGSSPKLLLITAARSLNLKEKGHTDIVLVPQPSNDVNDPLNWPVSKKVLAFFSIMLFVVLNGWVMVGPGPAIVLLMEEFNTDLNQTVRGVITWCVLTLGIGVLCSNDISDNRTSFGSPLVCTLVADRSFSLPHSVFSGQ
jgi:hypothetical protein